MKQILLSLTFLLPFTNATATPIFVHEELVELHIPNKTHSLGQAANTTDWISYFHFDRGLLNNCSITDWGDQQYRITTSNPLRTNTPWKPFNFWDTSQFQDQPMGNNGALYLETWQSKPAKYLCHVAIDLDKLRSLLTFTTGIRWKEDPLGQRKSMIIPFVASTTIKHYAADVSDVVTFYSSAHIERKTIVSGPGVPHVHLAVNGNNVTDEIKLWNSAKNHSISASVERMDNTINIMMRPFPPGTPPGTYTASLTATISLQ